MKRILITGAESYIGTSFEKWLAVCGALSSGHLRYAEKGLENLRFFNV